MAISTRWSPSPVTRPAHTPSTMARPSSSRPSSAKKEIAASRDSTTMPTLSIRLSAMCPFYTMSSVLSTNERPGGSTNNRVLSCHYVVSRCPPDALSVERYLSSRACHQWKHLPRRCGLPGLFAFTIFAQDYQVQKPQPEFYERVLSETHTHPQEIIHVGDSLHNDVGGVQAAGIRAIWVNRHQVRNETSIQPFAEITELSELPDVLAQRAFCER